MTSLLFRRRSLSSSGLRAAALAVLAILCTFNAFGDPIHDAARKGDVKKVKAILEADPKAVSSQDKDGDTPLHVAALHGQVAVVQVLLDAGADVNARNHYAPYTPDDINRIFYTNTGKDASISVNMTNSDPVVLIHARAVTQSDTQNGYTPLHLAIFTVQHKQLLAMLVAKGADVNAQATSGATPLFFAAMRGQKDDVQFLLEHGANVNLADAYGNTPLDAVLHRGYESFVPILVDKGADVNAMDQSQHRPLTYAMQGDLHKAVDILKKHGAHE